MDPATRENVLHARMNRRQISLIALIGAIRCGAAAPSASPLDASATTEGRRGDTGSPNATDADGGTSESAVVCTPIAAPRGWIDIDVSVDGIGGAMSSPIVGCELGPNGYHVAASGT